MLRSDRHRNWCVSYFPPELADASKVRGWCEHIARADCLQAPFEDRPAVARLGVTGALFTLGRRAEIFSSPSIETPKRETHGTAVGVHRALMDRVSSAPETVAKDRRASCKSSFHERIHPYARAVSASVDRGPLFPKGRTSFRRARVVAERLTRRRPR